MGIICQKGHEYQILGQQGYLLLTSELDQIISKKVMASLHGNRIVRSPFGNKEMISNSLLVRSIRVTSKLNKNYLFIGRH